jgi:hypothetical protein
LLWDLRKKRRKSQSEEEEEGNARRAYARGQEEEDVEGGKGGRWWGRVEENSGRAGWKGERRGEGREERRKGRSESSRSVGRLVGRWFWFVAADAGAVASLCILILPFRLESLILIIFFRKTDCCTVRGNTACLPLAQYHTKARTGLAASQISQAAIPSMAVT